MKRSIMLKNGDRYVGEVNSRFVPNGRGVMTYLNGSVYDGEFRNGVPNGAGSFTDEKGDKFIGNFRGGVPEGYGRVSFSDGHTYEGEWNKGGINGRGTMFYKSGDRFEGVFKNGIKQGEGRYVCSDGRVIVQTYENGKLTEEKADADTPVLTITEECKIYGSWHRVVLRFAAKVGEFKYGEMQLLELEPWDYDEALERVFTITEVKNDSVSFLFHKQFTGAGDDRIETVYRGSKGKVEKHEVKIGRIKDGERLDYTEEAALTVSCE